MFGQQEHPLPLAGVLLHRLLQVGVPLTHDELGRAHHIGPVAHKGDGAPLGGRGEGNHFVRLPHGFAGKPGLEGLGGVVVGVGSGIEGVEGGLHRPDREKLLVQGHQAGHRHARLGDGARLVHAEHVHPGQGLNGAHVVDQGPLSGQTEHGHRQSHAGEQVEPLGNHADEGGHRGGHGVADAGLQEEVLLDEQSHPHWDESDADDPDELVQGVHHLGLTGGVALLGLQSEAGGVGLGAHPGEHRPAAARHHKAARQQLVPRRLGDGVRLAGDEGLVDLEGARDHHRVRRDLAAR